ncbi:hypothetical protein VNO78_34200 [Psophocarpus tetragonolobus]|uniref:Homeobox domain-containing protein n=1 Tax=Psophocarpus tetragonolobus TaxID=3891 RepID=A0AAN9RPF8_PSOTE
MAILPSSSSNLDLTIAVPGFASSPTLPPSSSVKDLDINQVPLEEDWMVANMEDDEDSSNGDHPRKKLRLTKEQSRLLEESFKQNHTLNPEQAEADRNGVRVSEAVVWFSDRAEPKAAEGSGRAQSHEGGPTHRHFPHSCHPLPASTLTMCPRCERVTTTAAADKPLSTASSAAKVQPAPSRQQHPAAC